MLLKSNLQKEILPIIIKKLINKQKVNLYTIAKTLGRDIKTIKRSIKSIEL